MPSKKVVEEIVNELNATHAAQVAALQQGLANAKQQHAEDLKKKSEECAGLLSQNVEEQVRLQAEHDSKLADTKKQHEQMAHGQYGP